MRDVSRSIAVAVSIVILLCASPLLGQDWPQWRGANRDGKVAGFAAPQVWPKALRVKWKAKVGAGDATPALVGGRLYVFTRQGDGEVVLCMDAGSGMQLWKARYAAQAVTGPASRHPGPRSSPAVADGKVVTLGVGGVVSCFNAAEGRRLWQKDPFPKTVPTFFTSMSPILVDGLAVAHVGGKGKGAIIALDLATGEEKWRWAEGAPEYASPALLTVEGTKQIVTLTEKNVVGVAASDGKLLWKIPFPSGRRAYNSATPIVDGQTVIFTGPGRGTKAVKIEKGTDGFTARELWSNAKVATQFNTPVLTGGLLFGLSAGGNLFCVDAKTGKTAWTDSTRHGRGFAAVVAAGPAVLALPSTSELIAFKPDAKAYTELARIKVATTPTYAHPLIAGNRIFIKNQDTLTMSTIE